MDAKPSISKLARLIAIVVIVLSLVATSIPCVNAEVSLLLGNELSSLATNNSELQHKMNELEIQKTVSTSVAAKRSLVEQQLVVLYQEIETLNEQIDIYQAAVDVHENKINATQNKLEAKHEQNKSRISSMTDVLAGTCSSIGNENGLANLVAQISVVGQIAKDDKNTVEEMNRMLSNADEAKALLHDAQFQMLKLENAVISKRQELYDLMIADASAHGNDDLVKHINSQQIEEMELVSQTRSVLIVGEKVNDFDFEKTMLKTNVDKNGVAWMVPCVYRQLSSKFGYRTHPVYGDWRIHNGVDLSNKSGTPIYATRSGVVVGSSYDDSSGHHVVINHLDGYKSYYLHLSKPSSLKVGDVVLVGDYVGPMGSTGVSTGPHLHFGVRFNGEFVDPMDFIGYKQ